jgi:hypothetical protein
MDINEETINFFSVYAVDVFSDYACYINDYFEQEIKDGLVKVEPFHSGGGCCHYLVQLEDGRIITLHDVDDYALDITYCKWKSIDAFLDAPEMADFGFGFESSLPDYKNRHICIDDESDAEEQIKGFLDIVTK